MDDPHNLQRFVDARNPLFGQLEARGPRLAIVSGDMLDRTITPKLLERAEPGLIARRRDQAGALLRRFVSRTTRVGLGGLQLPFWPKTIIGLACILIFALMATLFRLYRVLLAAIDVILVDQRQKH